MKIEIVSHVWNYTRIFSYQLSSLALYPPSSASVTLSVYCCHEDRRTMEYLGSLLSSSLPSNIAIHPVAMERPRLMRRAIGRNQAARASLADVVWFADCDMVFGEGCLDELVKQATPLCFPRRAIATTHPHGDRLIHAVQDHEFRDLPWDDKRLVEWRYCRAIGGIQIVSGDIARKFGYLPENRRYQKPANVWRRTHEDVVYRGYAAKKSGKTWTQIRLPRLGRIRHSCRGREIVGLEL